MLRISFVFTSSIRTGSKMTANLFIWESGLIDGNILQSCPLKLFSFSVISSDYKKMIRNGLGQTLPDLNHYKILKVSSLLVLPCEPFCQSISRFWFLEVFVTALWHIWWKEDVYSNFLTPSPSFICSYPSLLPPKWNLMVWGLFACLFFVLVCFFGVLLWVQVVYLKWQPPFYITDCNCHRPLKTSQLTIIFSHFISNTGSTSANDLDVTGFAISRWILEPSSPRYFGGGFCQHRN